MDTLRYGIFKLGQIWTVTDSDGARLGFSSREMAIAALQMMIAVQGSGPVIVTLQGADGQLRTLLDPHDHLAWERRGDGVDVAHTFRDLKAHPAFTRAANESAANQSLKDQ
jgi:hypothetical protein